MKEYIGFIYKWINKKNNMFYIGSHKGNTSDGYVASGKYFIDNYKGQEHNFRREILEYVYDEQYLLKTEQHHFDIHDIKNNVLTYNLNCKASGGWKFCHSTHVLKEKRDIKIREGFKNGRVIYNKGKKIEEIYTDYQVDKIKQNARDTIGSVFNRNGNGRGLGLNNSHAKLVLINYLHGNLKIICEGNYYKWFSSGTYKKTNRKIWNVKYIDIETYDSNLYLEYIKYNGEKYDNEFLLNITENKNILNVHNRYYYLCENIETGLTIVTDIAKNKLKLLLKGGTGKTKWKFITIDFQEFKENKKKYKYYDGKNKLCGKTIGKYCSSM
jgi:hypothetical protein